MARYKIVVRSPRFLPVVLEAQLMSGDFEYALDYLIDQQLDLSRVRRHSLPTTELVFHCLVRLGHLCS